MSKKKYVNESNFSRIWGKIKAAFLSDISYDSTNKKLVKTKNGTASDVVAFDTSITVGTDNPVTSNAVKNYVDNATTGGKVFTKVDSSVTTVTNNNVTPFGAFKSTSIANNITNYGDVVGIIVNSDANSNPAIGCLVGTSLNIYTRTATTVSVTVLHMK